MGYTLDSFPGLTVQVVEATESRRSFIVRWNAEGDGFGTDPISIGTNEMGTLTDDERTARDELARALAAFAHTEEENRRPEGADEPSAAMPEARRASLGAADFAGAIAAVSGLLTITVISILYAII